ncbi:YbhB/YbcL family Raf kinase inhibitor-like protein [Rhizobium sp. 3T7]|uniref:YbhB/YbcL family Raf kinase inhibitor-like protein n=1 Tax=Rhizobium sp. 3T7 TaxID=2874922 RepID=UPI0029620489|nr:YbhB/YbcL family Raf kinase inhibitor-like protein [Rhizobium sp. 3T7]
MAADCHRGGLPLTMTEHGCRGQNGFAAFLKDGPYGGYMGACPPWNDLRIHRGVTVHALDTDRLMLPVPSPAPIFLPPRACPPARLN